MCLRVFLFFSIFLKISAIINLNILENQPTMANLR